MVNCIFWMTRFSVRKWSVHLSLKIWCRRCYAMKIRSLFIIAIFGPYCNLFDRFMGNIMLWSQGTRWLLLDEMMFYGDKLFLTNPSCIRYAPGIWPRFLRVFLPYNPLLKSLRQMPYHLMRKMEYKSKYERVDSSYRRFATILRKRH
jgi:hypothetical protein